MSKLQNFTLVMAAAVLMGLPALADAEPPQTVHNAKASEVRGSGSSPIDIDVRGGGNLPTNNFAAGGRVGGGLRVGLPFARGKASGPFAGVAVQWWTIGAAGEAASSQMPQGPQKYSMSGSVLYPALELGWDFRQAGSKFAPWTAVGLGLMNYGVETDALGTKDRASGSNFGAEFQLGTDVPFEFGGAIQLLAGYTYAEAISPLDQPVLGQANMGGVFIGLGWRQKLADY